MPVSWRGDYIFNGLFAEPYDILLSGGPYGYATSIAERDNIGIGLRKSRLRAACAALAGLPDDEIEFEDVRLALCPVRGARFHNRLAELIAASYNTPLGPGQFALGDALERDTISDIADLLLPYLIHRAPRIPAKLYALRVVRDAETSIGVRALRAPCIEDLCEASGIGQTWLNRCFNEIYGTSPMTYIRAHRLTTARNRFLDPGAPRASVKDVALSLGFTSSGRFAAEYRDVFGENPSKTLLSRHSSQMSRPNG